MPTPLSLIKNSFIERRLFFTFCQYPTSITPVVSIPLSCNSLYASSEFFIISARFFIRFSPAPRC